MQKTTIHHNHLSGVVDSLRHATNVTQRRLIADRESMLLSCCSSVVTATCHVQSLAASAFRNSRTVPAACEERRQNRPTHNNHFRDTVQINKARWIWNAGNELPALLRRMTILRNELIEKCDKSDRSIRVADDSRPQISIRAARTAERAGLMKTN